ncbi:hypothetical protein SAMN05660199_02611 [Klenkia soli]|uniref:Tetratricopeptide repeat-containing protein n=1 Tax=Klenkia soli TaxID=1052260 RepID=A0A1H0MFG7_9ACTN|nr:DUF6584 family protein [Klenkia soli]SDO78880.1 hypothetical protein SAMN05660199_02611 [Klenkia soli]
MPADQTLARARAELAAGDTARARQRLRGLVSSYPHRLGIRAELAAAYRAEGDVAQAGRWSFLCHDRDEAEAEAFLRATTGPVPRMRAMRWAGPEDAAGRWAQERLVELRTTAEIATGGQVTWRADRPRPAGPSRMASLLGTAGCFVLAVVLVALVVIGVVTVVRWIW